MKSYIEDEQWMVVVVVVKRCKHTLKRTDWR